MTSVDHRPGNHHFDGPLIAIAIGDTWTHVYADVRSLLESTDTTVASPGALEFFDLSGHRLAPVFNGSWELDGLRRTGERVDEPVVRGRLTAVLAHIRATVRQRLEEMPDPPGTAEEALAHLPHLDGQPLAECFKLLRVDFGDGRGGGQGDRQEENGARTPGSAWHVFWCH